MALSRSARILLLLAVDIVFFWIELIVGYTVGSLALVADSFHMLNDVMSLVVALYAIKLTSKNSVDSRYSYGWHRAEILAALINGVFLLALCFSISLEAIERFFSTPEIQNPKLIVVVGSFGLASNLVGLFLFHEHSHSHQLTVPSSRASSISEARVAARETNTNAPKMHNHSPTRTRSRSDSFSSLYGHPVATRVSLVQAAQDIAIASSPDTKRNSMSGRLQPNVEDATEPEPFESTPLLPPPAIPTPREPPPHGHAHSPGGSMNMRALLLHVFGDALGNVGVIATGLVIWLTDWKYKWYFDPVISLVITAIIFSSALPLVRSASFILLQAVPLSVSPESVRKSILQIDGVRSLHELHIWQLSESKLIASVHVLASRDHDFMPIAKGVRRVLHEHGVHSCTIQPEYGLHADDQMSQQESAQVVSRDACLIRCPADQVCDPQEHSCCPPVPPDV